MFQAGEFYAPVASSQVQPVDRLGPVPVRLIASPARELGSLVQDRQSTIMANLHPVEEPDHPARHLHQPQAGPGRRRRPRRQGRVPHQGDHRRQVPDPGDGRLGGDERDDPVRARPRPRHRPDRLAGRGIEGAGELKFTDYLYADDGAGSIIGGVRGLRALGALSFNPFTPAKATRIRLNVNLTFAADYGEVKELRMRKTSWWSAATRSTW